MFKLKKEGYFKNLLILCGTQNGSYGIAVKNSFWSFILSNFCPDYQRHGVFYSEVHWLSVCP